MDHRADLFSLGVMLYRMATGKLPFDGPNMMAVLTALATVTPAAGPDPEPEPAAGPVRPDRPADEQGPGRAAAVGGGGGGGGPADRQGRCRRSGRPPSAVVVPTAPPDATSPVEPAPVEARTTPSRRRTARCCSSPCGLLALVPLGWWLAAVVLRVETDNGTLVVEIDDPETEARIKDGKLVLTGPDGKVRYTLSPGERDKKIDAGPYKVRVEGADGLTLDTPEFTLKKGGKVTVRVRAEPKAPAKANRSPNSTPTARPPSGCCPSAAW